MPVNSIGRYTSSTPISYDTLVLSDFTNLFSQGSNHTDTFNVATTGSSSTVAVHIGDTIIATVINDNVPLSHFETMSSTGSLGLAIGSQNVSIISGADSSNFYVGNIGNLSLSSDGHYTYTITTAGVSAWESYYSDSIAYHFDTFLVSSTVGNTINVQALQFDILQESHAIVIDSGSSVADGAIYHADVFLYNSWASIYSSPSTLYTHGINNFELDFDRINISQLLTSSSDLLSNTIYIDPTGVASRSDIHVNHLGTDYTVASVNGVEASIPELMWNETWDTASRSAPVTSLNAVTNWTETLEIGGASYDAASKTFTAGGGWTMEIVSSGSPSVSGTSLTFGDHAGEVLFTSQDGITHDITHVDKINWHA